MKNILLAVIALAFQWQVQGATNLYNVRDYGAKGDGIANDRLAIQKAIDACGETGGSVVLKGGVFLTGQIELRSNTTLKIEETATLLGIQSNSKSDYPYHLLETKYPNRMHEDMQRRLIYGNNVENVTITGGGKIDGQGDFAPWMNVKSLGSEKDRPTLLSFVGSNNITVESVTLARPACWTQVYVECDGVRLRNMKVRTGRLQPNRDGIDIVDCHDVLIENCDIQSEDDGICFKSGSEYGCENVVVRDCLVDKLNVNAGNGFKLGTDGLGYFRNFEVSGLTIKNARRNSALVIESMDGAVVDNINISDCDISETGQAIFILLADRRRTVPGRESRIGSISNVHFKNIRGSGFTQQYPSIITGIEGHNIQNVTFENLDFELRGGVGRADSDVMEYDGKYPEGYKYGNTDAYAFYVRHTDAVEFINCRFTTEEADVRPWLVYKNVGKVSIK